MNGALRSGFPFCGFGSAVPRTKLILGIIFLFQIYPLFSQQPRVAGAHRGAVRAILREGEKLYSAGDDGFLGIWDIRKGICEERFQLSSLAILSMVKRPGKTELGIIESDGMGLYRISVWDYAEKTKCFSLRFRDPLTYITWSAMGSFLIVARIGRTALVFVHPETGEILRSPEALTGTVSFAATGPSERSMIVYQPQGIISYWNLESGEQRDSLRVPPNLASPRIFG
jgi:WD40 repeat protein